MTTLASLLIGLGIDTKDFDSDIGRVHGKIGGLGGILKSVLGGVGTVAMVGLGATAAAAGAGAVALGAGLKVSIGEAMEAQEVEAQLNAVLKSTGGVAGVTADMAGDLANSLMGVTRFGDETILSGENMLLTFTNIGRDIFPQATETMLNMSQAMGQDVNSSALQLGKALQDPILGVTALRRVGVNFTDAQIDMIKSLVESGNAAEAQRMILKELQTEFGGSAVAAGQTFAGQLDIMRNSMLNVAETAGKTLMPVLTSAFQTISPYILDLAKTLAGFLESEQFQKWLGEITTWLKDELPVAIETAKTWVTGTLLPGLKEAWSWMEENLIPAISTICNWLQENLPAAIKFCGNILKWYGTIIGGIGDAIGFLKKKWDEDFMGIRTFVETTWNVIKDTFALFKLAFEGDWYGFGEKLREMAETFMTGVFGALSKRAEDILGLFFGEGGLKNKNWAEIGEAIVNGIGTGMWNAMKGLADTILGIGNAIIAIFKGFFGISSPSSLFQGLVRMGIGGGMGLGFEGVAADMPLLMRPLTPALATIPATPAARGGGTGGETIIFQWHDHSTFRLSDRYEAERVLKPFIESAFRELKAKNK